MADISSSSSSSSPELKAMSKEELERHILRLKAELKKEKRRARVNEQVRQRVLKKARDKVERQMHIIMEKFKIRGFVYSFHPEVGTTVSGASESLNNWWDEKLDSYREDAEGAATNICSIDSSD